MVNSPHLKRDEIHPRSSSPIRRRIGDWYSSDGHASNRLRKLGRVLYVAGGLIIEHPLIATVSGRSCVIALTVTSNLKLSTLERSDRREVDLFAICSRDQCCFATNSEDCFHREGSDETSSLIYYCISKPLEGCRKIARRDPTPGDTFLVDVELTIGNQGYGNSLHPDPVERFDRMAKFDRENHARRFVNTSTTVLITNSEDTFHCEGSGDASDLIYYCIPKPLETMKVTATYRDPTSGDVVLVNVKLTIGNQGYGNSLHPDSVELGLVERFDRRAKFDLVDS
nr:hypothetical protein Iba_chr13aCG4560 [Ipomoea batatas]